MLFAFDDSGSTLGASPFEDVQGESAGTDGPAINELFNKDKSACSKPHLFVLGKAIYI
ncbi:hypothetical protein D3C78_1110940 [compost metagenome]